MPNPPSISTRLLSPSVVLAVVGAVTLARLIALLLTPLTLGVDEAQYWLWSQNPDFGYFSKPPMLAWLIAITTHLFGDSPAAIRLTAPLLHAGIALMLWRLTATLISPIAGRIAALLWIAMPAVAIGGFVISTDTPKLFFLTGFFLLLAPLALAQPIANRDYAMAGVALGLAMLSKYSGSYGLLGLALWWLATQFIHPNPGTTPRMHLRHWLILLSTCLIVISPNLWWNIHNEFVTTRHLASNANWQAMHLSLTRGIGFLASQAAVMGPVAFTALLLALTSHRDQRSWFLAAFILPPLAIITIQAIISDANANWAVAAYPMAVVLVSGWLAHPATQTAKQTRPYKTFWLWGILASNGIIASLILASSIIGSLGILTPASDPLRHLRGWETHHSDLSDFLTRHAIHTIITDRRQTAAVLTYYFRHSQIQVTITDSDNTLGNSSGNSLGNSPGNYYEATRAWQQHVATISSQQNLAQNPAQNIVMVTEAATPPTLPHVTWADTMGESMVAIGRNNNDSGDKHTRHLRFFLGRFTPP